MRRVFAMLFSVNLILVIGCGKPAYDKRIERTIEKLAYERELNSKLMPAPAQADGKFQELSVFVRPPKGNEYFKTFFLGAPPAGLFDITESFTDKATGHSMHVIGRLKQAKKAPAKGAAPAPEEPVVARGEFSADLLGFLQQVYGASEEIDLSKLKADTKKANSFKKLSFVSAGPNNTSTTVQVYIYKKDPYDAALIFTIPTSGLSKQISTIDLCLENFAVGEKAKRIYTGGESEEEGVEGAGTGASF